jgi:hypothetical protein
MGRVLIEVRRPRVAARANSGRTSAQTDCPAGVRGPELGNVVYETLRLSRVLPKRVIGGSEPVLAARNGEAFIARKIAPRYANT